MVKKTQILVIGNNISASDIIDLAFEHKLPRMHEKRDLIICDTQSNDFGVKKLFGVGKKDGFRLWNGDRSEAIRIFEHIHGSSIDQNELYIKCEPVERSNPRHGQSFSAHFWLFWWKDYYSAKEEQN